MTPPPPPLPFSPSTAVRKSPMVNLSSDVVGVQSERFQNVFVGAEMRSVVCLYLARCTQLGALSVVVVLRKDAGSRLRSVPSTLFLIENTNALEQL